jgi:hypothetical protein
MTIAGAVIASGTCNYLLLAGLTGCHILEEFLVQPPEGVLNLPELTGRR